MNMTFKSLVLFTLGSSVWASNYSLNGIAPNAPSGSATETGLQSGSALVGQSVHSQTNPARHFFADKAAFEGSFLWDADAAEFNKNYNSSQFLGFSQFSLTFPMGMYGALGLGFWQKERNHYEFNNGLEHISINGGSFEITPSYANGFDRLALGVAWHQILGSQEQTFSNRLSGATTQGVYSQKDKIASNGGYLALSTQYHGKTWDLALGVALPHDIDQNLKSSPKIIRDSILSDNTVTPYNQRELTWTIPDSNFIESTPIQLSLGSTYDVYENQKLTFDAQWSPELKNAYVRFSGNNPLERAHLNSAYNLGLGWNWVGSNKIYDSYFKKIDLRAGVSLGELNIAETQFYQGALGLGFPLGRRGSQIDLSWELGYREPQIEQNLFAPETYSRIQVTLKGLGNWGEPSRRYR